MNPKKHNRLASLVLSILLTIPCAYGARQMENLGRGVVAIRTGTSSSFISWRSLALDSSSLGFNLYRSTNGGTAVKLNSAVLTGGTCYADTTADLTQANAYYVKPVLSGVEQTASASYTLVANAATEPGLRIPIRNTGPISHVWVGDLDGDGEYDYVVCRVSPPSAPARQSVEAYKRDGTFLWATDQGPNSDNTNQVEYESFPSTLASGNWDGVTVADLDGDGKAEVILKTANGVVFGDGTTLTVSDNNAQFISVLNGMTGAERAHIQWPTDYASDGWMGMNFGTGTISGTRPSIIVKGKNRIGMGDFNMMVCAFSFDGSTLTQQWKWKRGTTNAADGHQIRIVDVNQDGFDEFCDIGFALNSTGTFRYSISGVVHGDRNSIGDLDPNRAGIEGFGIQQDNASGLLYFVYDASTGAIIRNHFGAVEDTARGLAADIDAASPGCEYWSFHGVHRIDTGAQVATAQPYPNLRLWWDGDLLAENLHDGKVEKWIPASQVMTRLLTTWNAMAGTTGGARNVPMFYGDIIGDWREEMVYTSADYTQLFVFTTPTPTTNRLYTLAQNPAYRNGMTIKGYMQSHYTDYFLGNGMSTPPTPAIEITSVLSQGKAVTYSAQQSTGNGAAKGNDGDPNTRWASGTNTYPQWWRVDLGSARNLRSVAIDWYSPTTRAYKYRVETSSDDVTYTTRKDRTGNTTFGNTVDAFDVTARYVRITVTGATESSNASFFECRVLGY